MHRWAPRVVVIVVALGCGSDDEGRPQSATSGIGPGIISETEPADDDDGPRLDLGGNDELREGCNYVDLLFVIDNSGSMCDAQVGLAAVLPELVDAIFDTLPADTDIHVGLTTTTFGAGGQHMLIGCIASEGPATIAEQYVLDEDVPGNGYQGRLYEWDGKAFFAGNTSSDADRSALAEWFPAAAEAIGCEGGAFEFCAAAAAYALHPRNAETNAGFVRDEGGVLAIFVLTNEVDQSIEPIAFYADTIRAAKAGCGGDDCIVTAGLLPPSCVPDANPVIWQFLNAFGEVPQWGDIDDYAGYAEVVSSALANVIVQTCDQITPVG
jgi:hypothetical protein